MTTLPGIRAELAAAVRALNAARDRVPEADRPDAPGLDTVEEEIDAAAARGDRPRAEAAITAWRDHHLAALGRCSCQKPVKFVGSARVDCVRCRRVVHLADEETNRGA